MSGSKRDRLVQAAMELFFVHGFAGTSLADVATHSGIPVGNVYYYFKSKESLAEAVLEAYSREVDEWHRFAESADNPGSALKRWLEYYSRLCTDLVQWGCPYGRLLVDFQQQTPGLAGKAASLYEKMMAWVASQFRAYPDEPPGAERRARILISRAQGISLLSLVLRDREMVLDLFRDLETYIDKPA